MLRMSPFSFSFGIGFYVVQKLILSSSSFASRKDRMSPLLQLLLISTFSPTLHELQPLQLYDLQYHPLRQQPASIETRFSSQSVFYSYQ